MALVLLDALLSIVPYALLAAFLPSLLATFAILLTPELVTHFRKAMAIYAALILLAWFGQSPQLTLFASIFSLIILIRVAYEILRMPRGTRERRWLWLTIAWFVTLALLPSVLSLTSVMQVLLLGCANVLASSVLAGLWLNHSDLSHAGKGRVLALAAHTLAIMLVTVAFLGWAAFAA